MTHKENIKAILECYFVGFKDEIIDSACNRILDQELSSSEKPNKWIPVSERLPEYNEDVIITHKDFKGQPTTDVAYFNEFSEFKLFWDEEEPLDVIAWMPLPKPYTESEKV